MTRWTGAVLGGLLVLAFPVSGCASDAPSESAGSDPLAKLEVVIAASDATTKTLGISRWAVVMDGERNVFMTGYDTEVSPRLQFVLNVARDAESDAIQQQVIVRRPKSTSIFRYHTQGEKDVVIDQNDFVADPRARETMELAMADLQKYDPGAASGVGMVKAKSAGGGLRPQWNPLEDAWDLVQDGIELVKSCGFKDSSGNRCTGAVINLVGGCLAGVAGCAAIAPATVGGLGVGGVAAGAVCVGGTWACAGDAMSVYDSGCKMVCTTEGQAVPGAGASDTDL